MAHEVQQPTVAAAERRGMIRAAEMAEPSDANCCEACRRAQFIADVIRANAGSDTEPPLMTVHDAAEVLRDEGWTCIPPKKEHANGT